MKDRDPNIVHSGLSGLKSGLPNLTGPTYLGEPAVG